MDSILTNEKQIFSVSQITEFINEILQTTFKSICIEGEISNFRPSSSGHLYFTLKDNNSQISAVMFKGSSYSLNFKPKDGDKVICTGTISVYAPRGNYQLIVTKMEIAGQGNILQMLEERKKKLASEGLFDESHKKPLPKNPKTIGVVTSSTGAAIRDIINVTKRRNKNTNIIVFPAIVQGEEAAKTIVKMIQIANFYKMCDVLIIGRGGGSLEDLLPFSEESVVHAIYDSSIPVISAVGHEIDWALCDYASDIRAATPSQAAELATTELSEIINTINENKNNVYLSIRQKIEKTKLMIKSFNPDSLEIRFRNIQQPLLNRFENAKENLYDNIQEKVKDYKTKIQNYKTILENTSPSAIFKRGYSMVTDANGKIITNSSQVQINEKIIITPYKGIINATVYEKKED